MSAVGCPSRTWRDVCPISTVEGRAEAICSARVFQLIIHSQEAESMSEVPIRIACGNYDRTAAISDGRVTVEGCDATFLSLEPEEIFHRAFRFAEFDVCEISFSSFLRTVPTAARPTSGYRRSSRAFSATPASTCGPRPASTHRKTCAANG